MNIIAISYKSDYDDTCRGCIMESFSSYFKINIRKIEIERLKELKKKYPNE